ncbi:lasso RiPP family leader peptide-containing protein [Saccharopolyspora sp. 5N708]
MDEQTRTEVYEPPVLMAVGEFSEDTLGFPYGGNWDTTAYFA